MFFVLITQEKFENALENFESAFKETRSAKSQHCYRDVSVLEKLAFQNIFLAHENRKPVWRAFTKITENDHSHIYKAKEDL